MNGIIAWFAQNRVAANLLMVFIIVAGVLAIQSTKKTILPDLNLDLIVVTIPYPGASPTEVEEGVIWRVEGVLAGMPGVESIESYAHENRAVMSIVVGFGHDPRDLKENIKNSLDGLSSGFPKHVGRSLIRQVALHREPVATLVVSGPADRTALKSLAENIKRDLVDQAEITQVEISSGETPEISIEVSELAMQRYGLSFTELAAAIQQQSVNISAGTVESVNGNTSIRTVGQAYSASQYEDLVVRTLPGGGRIYVKDVASVNERLRESSNWSEYNGQPAIFLYVFRAGKQNIMDIANALRRYIENPKSYVPESISLDISQDISYYFKSRVELLVENGVSGLALLFAILMLFLRAKLSFWVSVGIPISFLGAFCVLPLFGASFNMVSLFAFILVLGIVVDDAIIVGENIFTHMRQGRCGVEGAISGAQEVAKPVVFAVITTMIMFAPLLFLPGPEGQLMRVVPLVVIAVLAFSLVESLLILPAHLSPIKTLAVSPKNLFGRFQLLFSRGLEQFVDRLFRPFLSTMLQWRYPLTIFFNVMFFLMIIAMTSGWVKMVFFSTIEADYSVASVAFPEGSTKDKMEKAVRHIEGAAESLRKELLVEFGEEQVDGITANFGKIGPDFGDHLGSVLFELAPSESRFISASEISERWRDLVGTIEGAQQLTFDATLNQPGASIDFEFTGLEFGPMQAAAEALKAHLSEYDGVYGITDSMAEGSPELKLHMTPLAHDIGLHAGDLANQVRQAFYGVDIQSVQRGRTEVQVVLRYPEEQRQSLWYLENMQVRLPSGESVPLNMVADVEYSSGPAKIRHIGQRRAIRVYAYVDESLTNTRRINKEIRETFLQDIEENYPGVKWHLGGMQKYQQEFIDYLIVSVFLAFILMYILMAVLFRSYVQPLIVMYAIPFGVVGSVLGHLVLNIEVTLWSVIGMTAVSGVVVNDNLVLVDYVNRCRAAGNSISVAIREASAARFRPIVLTSVTTFFGLVPLMLEKSVQAQFLVPMAVALAFGVIFATIVSLVLVPATYHILDDIASLFRGKKRQPMQGDLLTNQSRNKAHYDERQQRHSSRHPNHLSRQGQGYDDQRRRGRTRRGTAGGGGRAVATTSAQQAKARVANTKRSAAVEPKTSVISFEQAYRLGYKAGQLGRPLSKKPFFENPALQESWESGWKDGRMVADAEFTFLS